MKNVCVFGPGRVRMRSSLRVTGFLVLVLVLARGANDRKVTAGRQRGIRPEDPAPHSDLLVYRKRGREDS